jgi:hypothetical protein
MKGTTFDATRLSDGAAVVIAQLDVEHGAINAHPWNESKRCVRTVRRDDPCAVLSKQCGEIERYRRLVLDHKHAAPRQVGDLPQ